MLITATMYGRFLKINYIYKKVNKLYLKKKNRIFFFFKYNFFKKPMRFFLVIYSLLCIKNSNNFSFRNLTAYCATTDISNVIFFQNFFY